LPFQQAFPARFGQPSLGLMCRLGRPCSCVIRHLSRCPTPTPGMLQRLWIIGLLADLLRLLYHFSYYREGFG
jgi:hypothetical protein